MRASKFVSGLLLVVLTTTWVTASPARAAGVTTHAWMALEAIDLIADSQLRALLEQNRAYVEAGAQFPDSGYWNAQFGVPGGDYGEEAHWQRFFDAYADQIREDPTCGELTDPSGPCAPRIAHLLGALGHGIGDEVWDWLFEPHAPDFGESYIPPELAGLFGTGGIELQMDMVAIGIHGRPTSPDTPPWPDQDKLASVFATVGRPDITVAGLQAGKQGMSTIRAGEAGLTQQFLDDILANMPETASLVITAPGGVDFAAQAIATAQENLWGRILGDQPPTEVSITYPAPSQTGVPTSGWDRDSFQPGSHPDRGGARTRIAAVLSYALPYVALASDPTNVPSQLPDGAMTLVEASSAAPIPIKAGYPRVVPYNPSAGEHTIDIQPARDLAPCTEYRVEVTDRLLDANGRSVTPTSWTFQTDGCPEPTTTTTTTTSTTSTTTTVMADAATPPFGSAPELAVRPASAVEPVAVVNPRFAG